MTARPRPLVLGHLGNTLAALRDVRNVGADGVEFDVRRSADGALVLHHDAAVDGLGLVSALTVDELSPPLPRLERALDACNGLVINVEVKNLRTDPDQDPNERAASAVAHVIIERSLQARAIVSSFSIETVDVVRALDPSISTALLTLAGWDQLEALARAAERGHRAVHPHQAAVNAELVDATHRSGMLIRPWAVDEQDEVLRMTSLGVDAIITDVPALAIATLAAKASARQRSTG